MDTYAVIGHPVAHSLSPMIHGLFAKNTEQRLSYQAIDIAPDVFSQRIDQLFQESLQGANVTVPFKQEAFAWADCPSERASLAQAANTLWIKNGKKYADNTDGVGLMNDICRNHNYALLGARVLVLGAGGAVRGILEPLLKARPAQIFIANRTPSKALELAERFTDKGAIGGGALCEAKGRFDMIINGTSASLQGCSVELPPDVLDEQTLCYDMMYAADMTPFQQWAKQRGSARCVDGLGMLVEQAAESFYLWRNVRPQTQSVIQRVREHLFTMRSE